MFRIEASLELLTAAEGPILTGPPIILRGYNREPPVGVTGQFLDVSPISVADIAGWCPAHRDFYLRKVQKLRAADRSAAKNWARAAGPLIQAYLETLYRKFRLKRTPKACGSKPGGFRRLATTHGNSFFAATDVAGQLAKLNSKIRERFDLSDDALKALLFRSAVADVFTLAGALRYSRSEPHGPRRTLSSLQTAVTFNPKKHLKISKGSAPDLIFPKFRAIGEIKSGDLKNEHFIAVAGYALGYESRYNFDVNLGVVYLVETSPDVIGSSRVVFFWITDELRQRFLLRRDQALSTLMPEATEPAVLSEAIQIAQYCERCSFFTTCHPQPTGAITVEILHGAAQA
jgi:CRISPR/Cas system-associated exonuclease Cas4 (RecB family)